MPRYKLRTLLIVLAVVAMVLAAYRIGYERRKSEEPINENQLVSSLERRLSEADAKRAELQAICDYLGARMKAKAEADELLRLERDGLQPRAK